MTLKRNTLGLPSRGPAFGASSPTSGGGGGILASIPLLSDPADGTPTATGATDVLVTSSAGTGTLYFGAVTNGGSCTDAQLIAGTGGNLVAASCGNQAITTSGVQTIAAITGLSGTTTYQIIFLSKVSGINSAQVSVELITTA